MRRVALLGLLLLVPLTGAQGVQQVTWSGVWETSGMEGSACDGSVLEVLDTDAFRFEEQALTAGCGEAHTDIDLPVGTGSIEVRFTAERDVEGTPIGPRDMVQELAVALDGQQATQAVFPPEAGDREATRMAFRFDVPPGASTGRITWSFADEGIAAGVGGESFSAAVRDVQVRVERVASPQVTSEAGEYLDVDEVVTVRETYVDLPVAPDTLRFSLIDGEVTALRTPAGVVMPADLNITQDGARTVVSLAQADLAGPGTYTLQSATRAPAPAVPLDGVHPAVWVLMAMPVLLGSISVHGAVRFYRQAPKDRRSDGLRLLLQNVAVAATYVILLITAYIARDRLMVSRFTSSTWLLLAQMGVVALAFLALWQLGARQMTRRLQADVAKAEEEERHLRLLNDELRRSNEDLERFARVASHDLKEPLRSVQFHAEKLVAKYADALDEKGRKSLELAAGGARRMRDLVDGLTSYSSVEQRMEDPARFEVRDAAESVLSALEALIKERRATVELGPLPAMMGHQGLIEQALQNLITNAIKHCGPGVHIQVRGRRGAGRYILEVEDDGPGIPQEYHDRIFEVFQRLEGRTEEAGTGMGLAIVKRIAELHEGAAGLRSEPGHGATFYLDLPETQEGAHGDSRGRR